mmetsp:Transcript_2251/g.14936  ORF Transcript_2251/g.14936 Transcript_2251/m.14936 type:complete len:203 (+) Transcript_2251:481-1089(+)
MQIQRKDRPSFASCFEHPTLPCGIHARLWHTFLRRFHARLGRGLVRCHDEEDIRATHTCKCRPRTIWFRPVPAAWLCTNFTASRGAVCARVAASRACRWCSMARIRPFPRRGVRFAARRFTSQIWTSVVQTRPRTRRGCAHFHRDASWRWRHVADARSRCSTWTARSRSRGRWQMPVRWRSCRSCERHVHVDLRTWIVSTCC